MANAQKRRALKWKSHPVARSTGNALRTLTEKLHERLLRTSALPIPAAAGGQELELPVLPDDPRDKAIVLLQAAAEVEHALMVQYLYAGYAFKVSPNRDILDIAIEEMSHLMTIQNLLFVIGDVPYLGRQDFGPPAAGEESLFPFELLLEPLTKGSLAKYIVAESPENIPGSVDPAVMSLIVNLATQSGGTDVNRVGTLYALLGAVFGSEVLLLQEAATGDPWYVMVNSLAAVAANVYGGRNKLHLPDTAFQAASADQQGSDNDWDRSFPRSFDEFRVHVMTGREEAVEALRDIGLQGEGPTSVGTEVSHFQRFYDLFIKFFGPDGLGSNPVPGVAAAPAAAVISVDPTSTNPNAITHPHSVSWAQLADARYGILLASLDLYLRTPADEREFLRGWCFAEMFAISRLSQVLVKQPRSAAGSAPLVAAIPFNLPTWSGGTVTWDDVIDALSQSSTNVATLQGEVAAGSAESLFLLHLASSDVRKLVEAQARKSGQSVRTKADKARDILDWAAGAGNPLSHSGSSPSFPVGNQGRFWNLALDEFKQTEIFGANIIDTPPGGGDPFLIEVLRDQSMPSGRPPLPSTSDEFIFLEAWVNAGCPDEPA